MSREAIDQMWQRAMRQSIEDNEMLTRYHFDALVRADEREQGQKWFDAVTAQHKAMILAERTASINAVLQVIKELRPALVLAAFADKDNAWVLDKVKESVEKLKEKT
jgi:hypothetical protein